MHVLSDLSCIHVPVVGTNNFEPGSIVGKGDFNSLRFAGISNIDGLLKQYVQLGTLAHRSILVNTSQFVTFT
jgi:hypothetical protein